MIEELTYQHYHAFVCSLEHYDELMELSKTQSHIHGSKKTMIWQDVYSAKLKQVLKNTNDKVFVSAVRNLKNNQLISYMITSIPYDQSCFLFFNFGEVRKTNEYFSQDTGGYGVWKLGLLNGIEKGSFDAFFAVKASAYRPIIRHIRNSSFLDEGVSRYNWQLNNIIMPDDYAKNTIEKILIIDNPNVLKREHPIAICHASMKPEERIKHFSSFFEDKVDKVKEESNFS